MKEVIQPIQMNHTKYNMYATKIEISTHILNTFFINSWQKDLMIGDIFLLMGKSKFIA